MLRWGVESLFLKEKNVYACLSTCAWNYDVEDNSVEHVCFSDDSWGDLFKFNVPPFALI